MTAAQNAKDTTYNGWTNYETWCVNLWIQNEEPSYYESRTLTERIKRQPNTSTVWTDDEYAKFTLADALQDWIEDLNPLAESASMWTDLIGAALSEVNWTEIAENYIEDAR